MWLNRRDAELVTRHEEGWKEVPGSPQAPVRHKEREASCVNAVSLMTETSRSVPVSQGASAAWGACYLLGVASHTGPPAFQLGSAGDWQNPELLAATWLVLGTRSGGRGESVERRPKGGDQEVRFLLTKEPPALRHQSWAQSLSTCLLFRCT